ncbi:MAG: hypothetical protein Ta2A_04520 [Treponemataceae bacterium]|nr:MAG: hypothetical protein Ta2A_04520 [Treponemataceae bacterium]
MQQHPCCHEFSRRYAYRENSMLVVARTQASVASTVPRIRVVAVAAGCACWLWLSRLEVLAAEVCYANFMAVGRSWFCVPVLEGGLCMAATDGLEYFVVLW